MPKVYNIKDFPKKGYVYDYGDKIYVGRPSKFGNPFSIGKDGSRTEVVAKFRVYADNDDYRRKVREELRGKDLVCWCAPKACHADVLLEIANS